jgi:hypothetical protein
MWAARRLIDKYPNESLAALDEVANGQGYVATKSKEIATAWRNDHLKI